MGAELWFGIRQRSEMGVAVFAQHVKVPTATERCTEKPPTWQRYTHLPQRKKVGEHETANNLHLLGTFNLADGQR